MATIDIAGFAASAEALALAFDSSRLPGLLSKRLDVPPGAVALVRDAETGAEEALGPGASRAGAFSAVLVKTGEVAVPFQVASLPTKDGMTATAGVEAVIDLPTKPIQVRELAQTLLRDRERLDVADLRAYLLPAARTGLALFVAARTAEDLYLRDPRPELEERVKQELARPSFGAGLHLVEVRHPSFYCEEYEQKRRKDIEVKLKEEELEARERLEALKQRLEKQEHIRRKEVDELAKFLEFQGVLKEVELKKELDRKRKEAELGKLEELERRLGKDDIRTLIFLLEDERLKAELIQSLIERDMSADQIQAKKQAGMERRLEERLEELSRRMATVANESERRKAEGGMRTRRVLAAFGKQVFAFDPGTNVRPEAPKEVYDLERGALGYLRSVRTGVTGDGTVLLAGAQRGVYVCREGAPADWVKELTFPREPIGQGGVNACAYFDRHVYATHSELGVWRFDVDGVARGARLFDDVTARNESTRGATITADGKLWFASGSDVYRHDLLRPSSELVLYRGTEDSITALVVSRNEVFAGTKGGRILRWSHSDPGSPREFNVRKTEPIFMLRVAEVRGEPHLLVGAKEHGLTAVNLTDGRAADYRARDQIRWVDGASDFVYGVSRGGYAIHIWQAEKLDAEVLTLRVADRVQDVWVLKERMTATSEAVV